MHPIQRVLISLAGSATSFLLLPAGTPLLIRLITVWLLFALTYLALSWAIIFKRPVAEIRKTAKKDDGSVVFVFILILVSSFASMFTVLLLMLAQKEETAQSNALYLPLAISSMMLSWLMVHSVYTFHYAHMYYDEDDKGKDAGGLQFPGQNNPNYIDFAYFSFVIGCTFQVSDVPISSHRIRKVALLHSLLSFGLNTFVVALTINIVGGLSK